MLDAGPGFVEGLGEEGWPVLLVGFVWDYRRYATGAGGCPVCLAGIALVANRNARRNVRPDVEQGLEMGCI